LLAGGLERDRRSGSVVTLGWKGMAQASPTSVVLVQVSKEGPAGKHDLEAQASAALDEARAMPHGPERTEAMKKAGTLRNAALRKKSFPKQGRPPKVRLESKFWD